MESVNVRVRSRPDRKKLQLFYVDPATRKERTKSAGTDDPAQAERAAALWQQQLERTGRIGGRISWSAFKDRVVDEYIPSLAEKTGKGYKTAINHLARVVGEAWLHEIDANALSQAQARWRKEGMEDTSVATHTRHILALLGWAKTLGLVREVPKIHVPRSPKRRLQRGRALKDLEYQSMIKHAAKPYKRIIEGIWLSGLRLNEAVALSWDAQPIRVDLDGGKYPRLVIHSEGQKSRKDEIVPITPDFADFLRKTLVKQRTGRVFPLPITSLDKIGGKITAAGEKAGIVVNDKGKFASAQDLRSAFGTRWKRKVHPMTLKMMMRHRDISTTMKFYVDDDCDEAAEEIWKCTEPCTETAAKPPASKNRHPKKRRGKRKVVVV